MDHPTRKDLNGYSYRTKVARTILIYVTFLFHGMQSNVFGPSLIDLEYLTGSTTSSISTVLTWRNGGSLVGALVGGLLVDRLHNNLVLSGALLVAGIAVATAPLSTSLIPLSISFGVIGVSAALINVGSVSLIIMMWKSEADPYQMALLAIVNAGGAITPQIFKYFLLSLPQHSSLELSLYNASYSTNSSLYNASYSTNSSLYSASYSTNSSLGATEGHGSIIPNEYQQVKSVEDNASNSSIANNTHLSNPSMIYIGYLIVAVPLLVMCVCHCIVFCYDGMQKRYLREQITRKPRNNSTIVGKSKYLFIFLIVLLAALAAGIEDIFHGLLITFTIKYLKWNKRRASDVATLFFVASSCSRALGILAAKYLKPTYIVAFDVLLITLSACVLSFGLHLGSFVPWLSSALTAFGSATLLGSLINWGNSSTELTGKVTALIFASGSIGKMVIFALLGYLFHNVSGMWFAHLNFIISLATLVVFCMAFAVVSCLTTHTQLQAVKSDDVETT